jgi:MFS family permease
MPAGVVALGMVSLFMDTSSELIHSLLPIFVVSTLGASTALFGLMEGVAESTALITKVVSGAVSDRFRRRKPLALLGYGLAAATKPLFALAPSFVVVFGARLLDRLGKGIRGAPRDALIADITPTELRGAAYGLRQSLDSVGALLGPLLALGLMVLLGSDISAAFWVAVVPAALSLLTLAAFVREPEHDAPEGDGRWPIRREALARLGGPYVRVVVLGAVLTLARFSEGFLILRATDLGIEAALAPLVMVGMNAVYAGSAYPLGMLSDRVGRRALLLLSALVLAGADVALALADSPALLAVGVTLWGLHMGMSQGLLSALVADAAAPDLRGTAFGLFNLVSGVAMLGASVTAGVLWDRVGPAACFLVAGGFALIAGVGLWLHARRAAAGGAQNGAQ